MGWKFDDGSPIYLQLCKVIKNRIASGAYAPGEKLPPVRDLALEAGVNPNTVQRAYSELERDSLVNADRTSGRFVTADREKIKTLRDMLSSSCIEEMFTRLRELGLTDEEIRAAVDEWGYLNNDNA
ncbi:MAG: GntR family transcriptional regulator [Firmicutes bacterium]|nr:GntR family transcriptional regulator [Bacillota bacterium]